MPSQYAKTTKVPVNRSRLELEDILERYGADQIGVLRGDGITSVGFRIDGRIYRFDIVMPEDDEKLHRQRWRVLIKIVQFKIEAIECGLSTFEEQFMPDLVVRGQRFGMLTDAVYRQLESDGSVELKALPAS